MPNRFKQVMVELRPSKIDQGGVGVFAIARIQKGRKIFEGLSVDDFKDLFPWSDAQTLPPQTRQKIRDFCVGTPDGFVPPDDLDFNKLPIEWHLNHSCAGNVGFDRRGDFIAIRDIKPGEELAYDYGLAESNPKFKMVCSCGAATCRGIISGEDWRLLKHTPLKLRYMHPFLKILALKIHKHSPSLFG